MVLIKYKTDVILDPFFVVLTRYLQLIIKNDRLLINLYKF